MLSILQQPLVDTRLDDIRDSIAVAAHKLRLRVDVSPESVDDTLVREVSREYSAIYGIVPSSWTMYIRTHSIATKFVMSLIEEGFDPGLLALMSLRELRDLYDMFSV